MGESKGLGFEEQGVYMFDHGLGFSEQGDKISEEFGDHVVMHMLLALAVQR